MIYLMIVVIIKKPQNLLRMNKFKKVDLLLMIQKKLMKLMIIHYL